MTFTSGATVTAAEDVGLEAEDVGAMVPRVATAHRLATAARIFRDIFIGGP
jgi:hypothetical protein